MRFRSLFLILPASLLVLMPLNSFSQWKSVYDPGKPAFLDLDLVSDSIGCFVGSNGSVHWTENAGKDLFKQSTGVTHTLYGVDLESADRGWMVGEYVILKTEDGGNSWKTTIDSSLDLRAVHFVDSLYGWAVGSDTLIHTSDGGASWQGQGAWSNSLFDVFFLDHSRGWALGFDSIYATTDGGNTWTSSVIDQNASGSFYDLHFAGKNKGLAVGGYRWPAYTQQIHKTDDGGTSWNSLKDSLGAYLFSVHFLDTSDVWACGYSGTILYSENGGDNWGQQTTPTDHELQAVMASSKDVAWAVGLNGTILRTTNGGGPTSLKSSEALRKGRIEVHPDPFRDQFTVEFGKEGEGATRYRIYDKMGRLIREGKRSGQSFRIDLSGQAPGIYLIRFRRGAVAYTKKVVKE